MSQYDAKTAYKRWAAVIDEETKPLTDDELAAQSVEYRDAYQQAMADDPLPPSNRYAARTR